MNVRAECTKAKAAWEAANERRETAKRKLGDRVHKIKTRRARENVADRRQLLRGYLEGLALRRQWVNLQREPLECEARLLLKKMEAAV